ncbi:ParB/RepB/Spo0J family partition protein [Sphingomonas solaris]|uniref:ParB/RepB/Spo0J family partition protein n=1 Tax=Alterirhizorhabdus solaris TaxID=2529389 RepID=A0A558R047_9SPHN|nr:ParB/RepB/Spo0J family partition protein [Sphingomonas solaris]TVV72761.1 ParB/RepB/Spo0J family partition protein [Sphingomonas solaris]
MAKSPPKITLSEQRAIPLDKLILSQANVRQIKAGVAIEQLADDIARRTLLQSLTVRPVLDEAGQETGMFEVPAGGRRFRALELLAKQKRLAKNAPIPCIVRTEGLAEEDSLAENVQRAPLHPLDQFRAFQAMREKGMGEEEIAAAFFVSVQVVKQRLRLAAVSPALLDVYAEDGITLDQLMAFTVNPDHQRQEQVWDALQRGYARQPYEIRRMLTEGAVRASDRRAKFVGIEAYIDAGGEVLNDLFQADEGGWLQDAGLLDMLVAEKLREAADTVAAEGYKWVETFVDLPYGHHYGLRRLTGEQAPLTAEQEAARDALQAEAEQIEAEFAAAEELSDEADSRMGEIETALDALDDRPMIFDPAEVAIAGAFVSVDAQGRLRVDRGFVRHEDEPAVESESAPHADGDDAVADDHSVARVECGDNASEAVNSGTTPAPEPEEDEGLRPIPDRLLTELTAHRTVALRDAIGANPQVAFLAALHALVLRRFYNYALDTCLELDAKSSGFAGQPAGLGETASAQSLDARHEQWATTLPKDPEALWDVLAGFDMDSRWHLFAHCVAMSVNATYDAYNRRPRALAHADRLAEAVDLDMAGLGWSPTVDNFLGRVTKPRILAAVAEARGSRQAQAIDHLKKAEMAERAQGLLAGTGWLPEPLRTPGRALPTPAEAEAISRADGGREPVAEPTADGSASGPAVGGSEPAAGDDGEIVHEYVPEADVDYAEAAE